MKNRIVFFASALFVGVVATKRQKEGCFVCRRVLPRLCFRGPERLPSVAADVSLDPPALERTTCALPVLVPVPVRLI
jgi:hypothetical protein